MKMVNRRDRWANRNSIRIWWWQWWGWL